MQRTPQELAPTSAQTDASPAAAGRLDRRRVLASGMAAAGGTFLAAALPVRELPFPATLRRSASAASSLLVRRNVLDLSAAAKAELVDAFLQMKQTPSAFDPDLSYYDQFVYWHLVAQLKGNVDHPDTPWPGHLNPGTWPWHRMLLHLFEQGLRAVTGKAIALPYWNWTQPESVDVVFSEDFLGPKAGEPEQNYVVTSGPFRNAEWELTVRSVPDEDLMQSHDLVRAWGVHANPAVAALFPGLPTAERLAWALERPEYDVYPYDMTADPEQSFRAALDGVYGLTGVTFTPEGAMEPVEGPSVSFDLHALVHRFVGGAFPVGDELWWGSLKTHASPNDPVFFLHHCFIDKTWTDWMARHGRTYAPKHEIHQESGMVHGVPGLNTPLPPFATVLPDFSTPGSVLDHHALGYAYDTDEDAG